MPAVVRTTRFSCSGLGRWGRTSTYLRIGKMMNAVGTLFALLTLSALAAAAPLRIVTTVPDLADITRRIGGDRVKVESLARGTEDIHNVPQRPSFLPKL